MKQLLNIGEVVDDGTGDYLREGGQKLNNNFNDLYEELGDGSNPFPAGAWRTINSSSSNVLNASFGKSYAINTDSSKVEVKLPKGSVNDYNKVIRLRDTFGTWQVNNVTVTPAAGDTLKGSSDSKIFNTNLTDLELVYCSPGRWEFLANKLLNKISNGDIATVIKKEYICEEGQTDFINIFDSTDYNLVNTHVYHRGNLLFYGQTVNENSDYGSPGENGSIVALDGRSIRLRDPAEQGDTVMIITYVDGIAQWRSTYNRLDCTILDSSMTLEQSVKGSTLVTDLENFNTVTTEELGYVFNSNTGLINPNTFEVYVNGVILNQAGKGGLPLMRCEGADAKNSSDCQLMGGNWISSNTDYSLSINDIGAIESITFDRKFVNGDVITIKWYNNDIGTTMEIDDIINVTDSRYILKGAAIDLQSTVRVTDYDNPTWPNVEQNAPRSLSIQGPADIFDIIYPIGTIYENSINPNNPSSYMGLGVWKLFGERKILVGWTSDNQDTQFGLNNNYKDSNGNPTHTAGGTGGRRVVTLTNDELPSTETDEKVLIADQNGSIIIGGCQFDPTDEGPAYNKYREERAKTNSVNTPPKSIDILPPYITVYRWMRIA